MQSAYSNEEVIFIMIDPVGIRQAVVIELEGVRVGVVSTITHDASQQC